MKLKRAFNILQQQFLFFFFSVDFSVVIKQEMVQFRLFIRYRAFMGNDRSFCFILVDQRSVNLTPMNQISISDLYGIVNLENFSSTRREEWNILAELLLELLLKKSSFYARFERLSLAGISLETFIWLLFSLAFEKLGHVITSSGSKVRRGEESFKYLNVFSCETKTGIEASAWPQKIVFLENSRAVIGDSIKRVGKQTKAGCYWSQSYTWRSLFSMRTNCKL